MRQTKLDDWIESYLSYMDESESPKAWIIWTAISTVAGALQRKVMLRWGHRTIYPNMYIVLVGPSGRGKGEAMSPAIDLFSEIKLPVIPDSITIEKMIMRMGDYASNFTDPETGIVEKHCSVQIYTGEMAVLMGQKDMKQLAILCDWYDCKKTWRDETKGAGSTALKNIFVNMLAGTAPEWITSMIPVEALDGGFTSRCIFVYAAKKGRIITRPKYTNRHKELYQNLTHDLGIISKTKGVFDFDEEAFSAYDVFYQKEEAKIQAGDMPIKDKAFLGYLSRRPLHISKLCIILAASRGSQGIININDFERAKKLLLAAEKSMPNVFNGAGKGDTSAAVYQIERYVARYGSMLKSDILLTFSRDFNKRVIDDALSMLVLGKRLDALSVGADFLFRSTNTQKLKHT